jgi:hypothetical protein
MLIRDLSHNLKIRQQASLSDLSFDLKAAPDAVRGMLKILEGKGRIKQITTNTTCGSCSKCDPIQSEIYQWIGR